MSTARLLPSHLEQHQALGARIVPFGGWDMPLHYGSQLEEHHAVRRDAGMFDVCHMQPVDLSGPGSQAFLRGLLVLFAGWIVNFWM